MKYYIIAGEASGDLHASNLIKQINIVDSEAQYRYWGGDLMENVSGVKPTKHYKDLAFMGFWEVLKNIRTIFKNINFCKKDIIEYNPDALILVDYPGFNLRIADYAKKKGLKVYYYISPTVWAWKEGRVKQIKRSCDKMFSILPFEVDFYKKHNYHVDYVGHPLLDAIDYNEEVDKDALKKELDLDQRKVIALLPGSRVQEIEKILPLMLQVKEKFKEYQFVVAGAPTFDREYFEKFFKDDQVKLVVNRTYDLFRVSDAALVASGTATLEAALFNVPEVVCYKANPISFSIAKFVTNIKYISLVNLIMDKAVLKELIQNDFNFQNLEKELRDIIEGEKRNTIFGEFQKLREILGGGGASKSIANIIYKDLNG
jgi:lipid-A-disaccharide synthase